MAAHSPSGADGCFSRRCLKRPLRPCHGRGLGYNVGPRECLLAKVGHVRVLFHCHLWPGGLKQEGSRGPAPGTAEHLASFASQSGFELAVAFAPFDAEKVHAMSRALPGQDPIRWLVDEIRPHSNILGFATIDLNAPDACAQLEQALKLGLRGIKLHPLICQLDITDRRHDPFYELAEEHSLPVIVHCGHGRWPWPVRYASPLLVEDVACRFPKLPFIIAHCGGAGFFRETMLALQSAPNCYADLALVFGRGAGWFVPEEELLALVDMGLARKLIYGLDYPWGVSEQVRADLDTIERWPLEDEVRAGILGGTIASLMRLNCRE